MRAHGRPAVLVVDDDPAVRMSAAEILESHGFDVALAADGPAATWLLAERAFDVVVLDLRLRHLDGTAVLGALEPSATVVVVSAFADLDEADIRHEFHPVIFDCLHKPVAPQRLIDVVTAAAAAGRRAGLHAIVKPIESRPALRLALVALARADGGPHPAY